jgi:hypothetical protein
MARFWKTNASINIPTPAITHAMMAPIAPVAVPNRAGSEKTPAPTIELPVAPTTLRSGLAVQKMA